jgi:L-malate glycosyltransferase
MSRVPVNGQGLRIAFCIDNMNVGGTEMNAVRMAERLVAAGVELRVFSLSTDGPLRARYAALGAPLDVLPIGSLYGRQALRCGREMAAILRRERVQVVHAHDFYSNIFAAPWTRLAGARFVASRRWWGGPKRRMQRWANRLSYMAAHRVVANSESVARLLVEAERVSRERVTVVPNFLDDAAFLEPPRSWRRRLEAELDLPANRVVVGVVASLQPIKDHATLVRAIALLAPRHPQLHLIIVGADSGSRLDLERLVADLGIASRVRFAGLRPSIPSMHWLFDISALTSVSEGLPNSLLEAMAAARPVVATKVGAIPDAVSDGTTGLLVSAKDVDAAAGRLEQLLTDPLLRQRFGEAGREEAMLRYSAAAAEGNLLKLYSELAGQQQPWLSEYRRLWRVLNRPGSAGDAN